MGAVVGAVTIGQSPRDDVLAEMADVLGGVRVIQCGALDELSPAEVRALAPSTGDRVLVSRLRDGNEVRLAERTVLPRLQQCVRSLEAQAELILVLCTGELTGLLSRRPLLFPGAILRQVATGLGPRRLGVLTPAGEQIPPQRTRWSQVTPEVVVETASPYARGSQVTAAASRLAQAEVDLVVMDCIGYTRAMKGAVRAAVGCSVLLAATTLAHVAAEVVGGG